jgi:GT2 family glycosyltransferase
MNDNNDASPMPCAIIIVTHNSQQCIEKSLKGIRDQTRPPSQIIIIDSGSNDTAYLKSYAIDPLITLHLAKKNIGFCAGNNIGFSFVDPQLASFVLFLNPDTFLSPQFLEHAIALMQKPEQAKIGALSGLLLGYDLSKDQPSGKIDSTGIFQNWFGKWADRNQGDLYDPAMALDEQYVPALCGALMLCRLEALRETELAPSTVMDPTFFMYKEDIDLSLRLRKRGWKLLFNPKLIAYHCRGWQKNRSQVPLTLRTLSAKNEVRLHYRLKSPYLLYSLLKYAAVKMFNL